MINKTTFVLMLAIAAALGTAIDPSLMTGANAREHTLCTGPGSSCDPGNTQSDKHHFKATGSGKCVPGQD